MQTAPCNRVLLMLCLLGTLHSNHARGQDNPSLHARAVAGSAAAADSRAILDIPRTRTPAPHWQVLSSRQYRLTVMNLDRSLAFYRDVLGLTLVHSPRAPVADRTMQQLTDTPGAAFRSAQLQLPGSGVQLVLGEFTHVERRRLNPRLIDPGAATLVMSVSDLEQVLRAARAHGVSLLTRQGRPISAPEGSSVVLVDPDGFYVRLIQPTDASTIAGKLPAAQLVFTVADPGPVLRFYQGLLGLEVTSSGFGGGQALAALFNASGIQADALRAAISQQPVVQFMAFRGLARHTYLSRPQDPGTPAAVLAVSNLSAAVRALRATGAPILSAGGQPVSTPDGDRAILVRDAAGILLELVEAPGT